MKYLFAAAFLLSAAPALAGPKVDRAVELLSDVYGELMATAVVCHDLEAKLPKNPLNDVASAVATMGVDGLSQRARALMTRSAEKETRAMPPEGCNDQLRARFESNLGHWQRNRKNLSEAIAAERGY